MPIRHVFCSFLFSTLITHYLVSSQPVWAEVQVYSTTLPVTKILQQIKKLQKKIELLEKDKCPNHTKQRVKTIQIISRKQKKSILTNQIIFFGAFRNYGNALKQQKKLESLGINTTITPPNTKHMQNTKIISQKFSKIKIPENSNLQREFADFSFFSTYEGQQHLQNLNSALLSKEPTRRKKHILIKNNKSLLYRVKSKKFFSKENAEKLITWLQQHKIEAYRKTIQSI